MQKKRGRKGKAVRRGGPKIEEEEEGRGDNPMKKREKGRGKALGHQIKGGKPKNPRFHRRGGVGGWWELAEQPKKNELLTMGT